MEDFAVFAADWRDPLQLSDLELFADNWLTTYIQPPSLAHWRMDESSGTIVSDWTANEYDLVGQDGFVISDATVEGMIDDGFLFDGSGEKLVHPTLLDVMPDAITVTGWVKPDATGMGSQQTWFSKKNHIIESQLMLNFKMAGEGVPNIISASGRSASFFNCDTAIIWEDDTWYHIAYIWDAAGMILYVNGQPAASLDNAIMGDGTYLDLVIGTSGEMSYAFKGIIDDVRLYSSALSAPEIWQLYVVHEPQIYTLLVNGGTGSGSYTENYIVGITADALLPTGQEFDTWTGDTAYVADVDNPTTTVTMPAAMVVVTAAYEAVPLYSLTVNSGTGDGSYIEALVVNIAADTAPAGQEFDVWTGDTAYVANVNDPTTTVTMPAMDIAVTATYKSPHSLTVNSGTGDGSYYKNVIVEIVASAPASGQMFDVWTGDVSNVADVYDWMTTITMPDTAAEVTATYKAVPPHNPPVAAAGDDQMLDPPMNSVAILKGSATDDGIPGTGLSYTWSKVSGPGTVSFDDADSQNAKATITTGGEYVLRLSVSDGDKTGTDDLTILVHNNGRLTYPITYTDIPKHMSDMSNYTEIYVVDLAAFNIYNDDTHPVETLAGINNMLQATKTMNPKPNRIVFPTGTYRISEDEMVLFDLEDTIVDLNGSTFKLNPSDLITTSMMKINGARNFRLTNGTLMGDRYDHDYSTGYHSGGAIGVESGYNMEIDHLTVRDFTGYAFYSSNDIADVSETGQSESISNDDVESGGFNSLGVKIADSTKIRTIEAVSLTKFLEDMEFEFGHTYGYQGYDLVSEREYQAYFYDSNMNFIQKKDCLQYKKQSIPTGARWIHFEFNQPAPIPNVWNAVGRLTDMEPAEHVWMHHNWLYRNRGLGQAFCGGQKWIIENNHYEENGIEIGAGGIWMPAMGIDFEDGWDLMQDIVFRNNTFWNNRADLVVCAGTEMIFENNQIDSGLIFYSRCNNFVSRNNVSYDDNDEGGRGSVNYGTRTGELSIHDNTYINGYIQINNHAVGKPPIMLEYDSLDNIRMITTSAVKGLGNEHVYRGCTFKNTCWWVEDELEKITFENCTFLDTLRGLYFWVDGPDVTITETDCTGTPTRYGEYTDREVP